jgi:hypothetical protein
VENAKEGATSVVAAWEKCGEDTQIRIAEEPAFRLPPDGAGGAHNRAEMLAAGYGAKMLGADSRQTGNFVFGENFLSGLNRDHSAKSSASNATIRLRLKRNPGTENTYFQSNTPAVYRVSGAPLFLNLQR